MANYTIQQVSSFVNVNTNATEISESDRTVYVVPNAGYVVSASDFSLASSSGITSINRTDTATAGEPGNQVKVILNLDSATLNSNTIFQLNLNGDAKIYNEPLVGSSKSSVDYYISVEQVEAPVQSTVTLKSNAGATIGAFQNQEVVAPGETKVVGSLTFEATSTYYFSTMPIIKEFREDSTVVTLKTKDIIRDVNGFITKVVYEVCYSSLVNKYLADAVKIKHESVAIVKPSVDNQIKTVDLGIKTLSNLGETRYIKVYGNVDSQFDFSVVKNSDSSTVYSQNNINIVSSDQGVSSGLSSRLRFNNANYDYIEVTFPASATAETYNIVISADTGTTLGSNIPTSNPNYTLKQYANPTFKYKAESLGNIATQNSATRVGRVNKTAEQLSYLFDEGDLNFNLSFNVLNMTLSRQPRNHVQTIFGEVKTGELNKIYFDTSILNIPNIGSVDTIVVEDGEDTSAPIRIISGVQSTHISVVEGSGGADSEFTVGKNKSFTIVQSDFDTTSVVKSLNGGTELVISDLTATQDGNDYNLSQSISINKFGTQDVDLTIDLDNFSS